MSDKPQWAQTYKDPRTIFFDTDEPGPDQGGPLRDQSLRALRSADEMVEALFDRLHQTGEERDTIAIFLADNGFMWREHGVVSQESGGFVPDGSNANVCRDLTGCGLTHKGKPYTESIKIPFFLHWPANTSIFRGITDPRYVANVDLAPTVLRLVGLGPYAEQLDGRSLLDGSQARTEILTENYGSRWSEVPQGTWASLRGRRATGPAETRHYQYIEYYEDDGVTPRVDTASPPQDANGIGREYYDLTADPFQLNNLLRDGDMNTPDPGFVEELHTRLQHARLCDGVGCRQQDPPAATDTQPPRVWFVNPSDGVVVGGAGTDESGGNVYIEGDASDNIGVKQIDFYQVTESGPVLIGSDQQRPFRAWLDATSLAAGTMHTIRAVATDYRNNTATREVTVQAERYDVQATGGVSPVGTVSDGEKITYYFDRSISPTTFAPAWDGTARTVTVQIEPDAAPDYDDLLTVPGVPALGTVDLGNPNYWGWRFINQPIAFPSSTMEMEDSNRQLKITLGGLGGSGVGAATKWGTMIWTPASTVCPVGPACSVSESVRVNKRADEEF